VIDGTTRRASYDIENVVNNGVIRFHGLD